MSAKKGNTKPPKDFTRWDTPAKGIKPIVTAKDLKKKKGK